MHVRLIIAPAWSRGGCDEVEYAPSQLGPSGIVALVQRLNGDTYNDLYLEAPGGDVFAIAGGPDLFLLSATNSRTDAIVEPRTTEGADEHVILTAGGQQGRYSRGELVTLDIATAAAVRWAKDGTLIDEVAWVEK